MLRRVFVAATVGGLASGLFRASAASERIPLNVVDAMPAFWRFWDDNLNKPMNSRVRAFFETVVAGYPDLFRHGLIASGALTDLADVPEAQDRVATYLNDVQPYIPAMRRITDEIHEKFYRYLRSFQRYSSIMRRRPRCTLRWRCSVLGRYEFRGRHGRLVFWNRRACTDSEICRNC